MIITFGIKNSEIPIVKIIHPNAQWICKKILNSNSTFMCLLHI